MNRETKRAMARQQKTTDQGERLQQLRKQQATRQQQAVKSAENYLDFTSFSPSGLYDQLVFEGFTPEQAQYGVDNAY